MFGIHDYLLFVASSLLLNITPGQDTFYILGRTLSQGRRAGFASVLGISAGTLVHTLAAACGLSAILATSASAFLAVKFAGAAYLIYLGVRMFLSKAARPELGGVAPAASFFTVFRQGMLTNVLNPKVALFFLAFMPQFISADSTEKFAAFLTLGLTFVTTGAIWCSVLVWMASLISARLQGNSTVAAALNRLAGGVFVFLGIRIAVTK